ncbi:hypothetical protein DLAC_10131 [Tieghemostelium lacteum]|uniref:Myotubularin phosphatase domain-containing protein n=1 Tax=Tieghemostelium lacteum TaxID=361077 RepID=A0A151Z677_TIELA|nr:hypothetical protein DLAC_10131 [Tieghemostelium lacteum]|eukprot:KYQ89460.1 hypothetical protein DLAC_10131 [Tieghemostelium lacteum]
MNSNNSNSNNNSVDNLLLSISKSTDKLVIKEYLKRNPNVNSIKNSFQQTLLHLAAMNGNSYVVKLLFKKKYIVFDDRNIQIDLKDKEGYTPLLCSIAEGHFDISEKLLNKGADPNARTSSGSSPLHLLSIHSYQPKSYKIAQQLIESGAYLNHKDSKFDTPLHRAIVRNYNNDLIRLLLEHGANPNIVNKRGRTCQHTAIEEGKLEALELFIQFGAYFHKLPSQTTTLPSPLDYALQSKWVHIQNFFNERVGYTGENIIYVEKSVLYGRYTPFLFSTGDSIQTSNHFSFQSGRLIITNYRVVFKLDTSPNQNNNTNISKNWLFSENEELMIPISSIANVSTNLLDINNPLQQTSPKQQQQQQQQQQQDDSNSSSAQNGIIYDDDYSIGVNTSFNSIQMQNFSQTTSNQSTSGNLITSVQNNNNIVINHNTLINSNNHLNIDTKDFKLGIKFFFSSTSSRDKIFEILEFLYKLKIEKSLKMQNTNQNLQKKIVDENIKLAVEYSRIEHIDRYESYGIFEESVPILFSYFYKPTEPITPDIDGWKIYDIKKEYSRFGILEDSDSLSNNLYWRFTTINKDYKFCSTYPSTFVVSRVMLDKDLEKIFSFRSKGRIPVLSWKDPNGYASITRCSQPLVGIERTRCVEDETLCSNLSSNGKPLYLLDARPKLNAIANTANGAGFENISNYNNCRLVFMNIPNIHVMRKSLEKLVSACNSMVGSGDDSKFWVSIEESGWLTHIKSVLTSAVFAADLIMKGTSVLVHCSDGWDRTPQMTSLTQILLDPFYRTILGLEILIEKEWLSFGHKFGQRIGHTRENEEEVSPIFQQFLDCVFQLINQFPVFFEYSPNMLLFLSEHQFSCKYGTFLHNCDKDRTIENVKTRTVSIWTEINQNVQHFVNPYYSPPKEIISIRPNLHTRSMELWKSCYMKSDMKSSIFFNNMIININNVQQQQPVPIQKLSLPPPIFYSPDNTNQNSSPIPMSPVVSPRKSVLVRGSSQPNSMGLNTQPTSPPPPPAHNINNYLIQDYKSEASSFTTKSENSSPTSSSLSINQHNKQKRNSLTLSYSSNISGASMNAQLSFSNNHFNQKLFDKDSFKSENQSMMLASHRPGLASTMPNQFINNSTKLSKSCDSLTNSI